MYHLKKQYKRRLLLNESYGFTLVEFVIVVAIIGVLTTLMNPISNFITQKAREREGSLLIRSFLEASTLYFSEYGKTPNDYKDLSKYVSVRACKTLDPKICKKTKSIQPQSPKKWNSIDGNYIILMDTDLSLYSKFYAIPHKKSTQKKAIFGCVNTKSNRRKINIQNNNLHLLKFHSFC